MKTKMPAMTVNCVRLFDTVKQGFVKLDEIPVSVQSLSATDGVLYWADDKTLRTMDLETRKVETAAELPDDITAAALGRGMLAVACGPDVYAVYLPKP